MTAPKICDACGCALDADEICACQEAATQSANLEFIMGTDLEALPKTIDFNFEDLKSGLAKSVEHYNNLVVTEGDIKAAKDDRSRLNKLREAIENKRKEVKKECMVPYTAFEAQVKELVALIDAPIAAIDGQLNTFEEKRRSEKLEAIRAIYEETVGELRPLLPFDKLWRDEWYNVGGTLKKIREAIIAAEDKAASDLEVLSTVESEFAEAVKLKYLERLDISEALRERARLQERAARLREYEERRATATNASPTQSGSMTPPAPLEQAVQPDKPLPDTPACGQVPDTEKRYRLAFECELTQTQAIALSAWLTEHNIAFRRM